MKLMVVDERWVTSTTPLVLSHLIIINRREGKKWTQILKFKISAQVNNRIKIIIRLEFIFDKQRRKEKGSTLAPSFKKALGLNLIFNWLSESVSSHVLLSVLIVWDFPWDSWQSASHSYSLSISTYRIINRMSLCSVLWCVFSHHSICSPPGWIHRNTI